tara:strand:+ start:268 stop:432 length:165 start_codon:yes stop_codon:yes gene_type:complete
MDNTVTIYSVQDGSVVRTFSCGNGAAMELSWRKDGKSLAGGLNGNEVILVDVRM